MLVPAREVPAGGAVDRQRAVASGQADRTRESGRVTGFQIDTGRIQNLRFGRVEAKLPK